MRAVKIAHGNANTTLMLENSLADIYKVKHVLIIWPNNSTPRYLPKRNGTYVHTADVNSCFILVAASLSPAKWVKLLWYIHTVEYFSATSNELHARATTWMDFKSITPSG